MSIVNLMGKKFTIYVIVGRGMHDVTEQLRDKTSVQRESLKFGLKQLAMKRDFLYNCKQ